MKNKPDSDLRKIAVVGAGPVGCILAAFLAKGGHEVVLCDVVSELTAPAVDPGIVVEGVENIRQPVAKICSTIDALAEDPPDVVFLTVKANANPLIASAIEGFYREGMAVVSWQNGIDTEASVAEILGKKPVFRAVVNYGCRLIKPGHVHMSFHHPVHYIQELDASASRIAADIAGVLTNSGLPTKRTGRIVSRVWRKSIMNACMNPVCAVTGLTMAQAMGDPIVFGIIDALVKECIRIARANEIDLGWDFYPYCIEYMKGAGNHKPSMLVDIENRRRTEIDFINGKFVEYGRQAGVETPYNNIFKALVKAIEI